MLFNSIHYLVFFPLVVAVFFALPHAGRKWFLLAAGNVFYGWWDWRFLILLWFSIVVDFFMALKIAASEDPIRRKFYLVCSLSVGLGILGFFKYFNFFADSAVRLAGTAGIELHPVVLQIILPVGVSFYTFQSLGYALDVYRRRTEPERDFWLYSLFVCFFPQMVAGPIERSTHLLPQLRQVVRFDYRRAVDGLLLIGWGLFKKLVIADRAALLVNQVYNHPGDHAGLPVWLATYLFAFQIYCDFSGYSDIAVGSARVLGYDVMRNFRRPYLARSIADFWQRWHIS